LDWRAVEIIIPLIIIHLLSRCGIANEVFDCVSCASLVSNPLLKVHSELMSDFVARYSHSLIHKLPIIVHVRPGDAFVILQGQPVHWMGGIVLGIKKGQEMVCAEH
jgi:hypothetical protein